MFLKVRDILQKRVSARKQKSNEATVNAYCVSAQNIADAETAIFQWLHWKEYQSEVLELSSKGEGQAVSRKSSLHSLNPFLDHGILRVRGRLSRMSLPDFTKHPIILPRKGHITTLIIRDEHRKLGHAGRNHVLSNLRSKFWIVKGNSAVRQVLRSCVPCRRIIGPVQDQRMADLPACRLDDTLPPFSYTGVDYFGPFQIREGRKELKRYGVLFTCLVSRAVHIEVSDTLGTDSFINALRRFIARRGNVSEIHSDNGTNFVGADRELQKALKEVDHTTVEAKLQRLGVKWIFNPPSASHMGGVWERNIRTVRKILVGLLAEVSTCVLCMIYLAVSEYSFDKRLGLFMGPGMLLPNSKLCIIKICSLYSCTFSSVGIGAALKPWLYFGHGFVSHSGHVLFPFV